MQGVRAARTLGSLHSQGLCLRRSLNYRLSKPSPTRLGGACAPAGIAQALHTGGRRGFLTTGMATDLGVGYEGGTPPCVAAFVTAPKDDDVALKIAKTLVEEQLVACVNIISQNQSVYMCGWPVPMTEESGWEGKLCVDEEKVMMMKTKHELAERLVARVKQIHPYDTPEVIVLPITAGSDAYLKWVASSTTKTV